MVVFSLIPHKELRFLMPIIPFAMLLAGEFIATQFKTRPDSKFTKLLSIGIRVHMLYEFVTFWICN